MNRDHLRITNDAALHRLVDRSQQDELDFRERLALRLDRLRDPGSAVSGPVYQRIFFTLKRLQSAACGRRTRALAASCA
jgi:hypothetical protein